MNRRAKRSVALACVLLLGAGCVWVAAGTLLRARARAGQRLDHEQWRDLVDAKARAAAGGDERAVRELVNAVFLSPQLEGVPWLVARPFKERLIRSEVKYRRGASSGVTSENVVRVFDELATKFGAPEYARTDAGEVNALRVWLSHSLPSLARHGAADQAPPQPVYSLWTAEVSLGRTMSPVEAALVALWLAEQKELNELFLLTRAERAELTSTLEQLGRKYELTREERFAVADALVRQLTNPAAPRHAPEELAARAKKATEERGGKVQGARLVAYVASPRVEEMRAAVQRASEVGLLESLRTAHAMLDLLGVER